jgi:hypothetical protein
MAVDRAVAGDRMAMRLLLEHLLPKRRARPIALDLPADLSSGAAVLAAFDAAVRAMAAGEITPDEALKVARLLERRLQATMRAESWEGEEPLGEATPRLQPPPLPSPARGEGFRHLHFACIFWRAAAPPPLHPATESPDEKTGRGWEDEPCSGQSDVRLSQTPRQPQSPLAKRGTWG